VVLAHGPSPLRMPTVDIYGMARDLLQAVAYLHDGQLADHLDLERTVWLGGSFSSLVLYRGLWDYRMGDYGTAADQPDVDALIWVGSISDAFLMAQSLYDVDLAIPPRYQNALAAIGRPDRDPAFFLSLSPAFQASHLPPCLIAHTYADEVVPYAQSERFAQALQDAGVEHELYLYQDTSHYLDQVNITPETAELYRLLATFLDRHLRPE
jgi:acetyl esterase/lipase